MMIRSMMRHNQLAESKKKSLRYRGVILLQKVGKIMQEKTLIFCQRHREFILLTEEEAHQILQLVINLLEPQPGIDLSHSQA